MATPPTATCESCRRVWFFAGKKVLRTVETCPGCGGIVVPDLKQPSSSKYKSKITTRGGLTFHSLAEADRWDELRLLESQGAISDLDRQVEWDLAVNDVHITTYKSDFEYIEGDKLIVEDCKGFATPEYKLKKKLMKAIYNIDIRETRPARRRR